MTNPLAQDLGGVVRLLEKATPGEWRAGFMHDGEFVESATDGGALQKGDGSFLAVSKTANGYNYQDAKAIAAAVNFLRTHSAEIAGALSPLPEGSLRFIAKRNLRRLIEIGSADKELMLNCLEELS